MRPPRTPRGPRGSNPWAHSGGVGEEKYKKCITEFVEKRTVSWSHGEFGVPYLQIAGGGYGGECVPATVTARKRFMFFSGAGLLHGSSRVGYAIPGIGSLYSLESNQSDLSIRALVEGWSSLS